ncbi:probable 6-phosphogluconolactonase 2 [Magnolia sinica]|uniref:probable 6-phosphogluconolactonase 2 n=1 Tax=Magnolia sinica TaxID=86752 RepID=UPI00265A62BA|nr:probable 6-phosphogluconolactonase 2 [Magnolia sinica]
MESDEGSRREKRSPQVRIFESDEELSTALADYVAQLSEANVKERGAFSVVLSGGNLTKLLRNLTKAPYVKTVDWSKWHVFWAEENVVAKKHPDSNYKQAKEGFLSKVPILPAHIISVNHGVPAESAAEDYEFSIRQLVRNRTVDVSRSSDCPRFDLILLVLGSDGHVASLFPSHPVVDMESQWVAAISDAPRESITLTLPVINSAANVAIIATGSDVAMPLASAISDDLLPHGSHPAQLVSPGDGKLVWFADASAASLMAAENS